MAKQIINVGIEGNDGTGDSDRDVLENPNENFTELYAVFGQGGQSVLQLYRHNRHIRSK